MSNKIELGDDGIEVVNGFKLAALVPPDGHQSGFPKLKTAPGFRIWTKNEITDAIKAKGFQSRRKQFTGTDWILNQGQVGSCCPTATTGAFRRTAFINGVSALPRLDNEFLYAQINDGSDNGAMLADANAAIQNIGIIPMKSNHRYNIDIYKSAYGPADYTEAKNYVSDGIYEAESELELATILLSGQGAGVYAIHVGNNFMNIDKDGFPGASPSGLGNHAVCPHDVEIINGDLAFDTANSWGLDFGQDGYFYTNWKNYLATTTKYHKFFVCISVKIKSQSDSIPSLVE